MNILIKKEKFSRKKQSLKSIFIRSKMLTQIGQYEHLTVLNEGIFGQVHLIKSKDGNIEAMKIRAVDHDSHEQTKKNLEVCMNLSHRHLVKVLKFLFYQQSKYLAIFSNYHPRGNLCSLIGNTTRQQQARIMRQLIQGLAYLHKNGISHRNLKPENILINDKGQAQISDIGVQNIKRRAKSQQQFEDPYMAPEIISKESSDSKSGDVWSLGIIILELLIGKRIKITIEQIQKKQNSRENCLRKIVEDHVKEQVLKQILLSMLQQSPNLRAGSGSLLLKLRNYEQTEFPKNIVQDIDQRIAIEGISQTALFQLLDSGMNFPNLQRLILEDILLNDDSLLYLAYQVCRFKERGRFISLTQIDLSRNQITDLGFTIFTKCLSSIQKLQIIKFNRNQITDQGIIFFIDKILVTNKFRRLGFAVNRITDTGFIHIIENPHKLPQLERVGLAKNHITNASLQALAKCSHQFKNLQLIYLDDNYIKGDAGLNQLFASSKQFPNLRGIGLNNNKITNEGLIAQINLIKTFSQLTYIILWNNQITDYGLRELINAAKNHHTIKEISLGRKITNEGLKLVSQSAHFFPNLQALGLGILINDQGIKTFTNYAEKFTALQKIGFSFNKISDNGLDLLLKSSSSFKKLTKVRLKCNQISKKAKQEVKNMQNLLWDLQF